MASPEGGCVTAPLMSACMGPATPVRNMNRIEPDEDSELQPLRSANVKGQLVKLWGFDVELAAEGYQQVIMWPVIKAEDDQPLSEMGVLGLDPWEIFEECTTRMARLKVHGWRRWLHQDMTLRELQGVLWREMVKTLTSEALGFEIAWRVSMDEDEYIMMVKIEGEEKICAHADMMDLPVPVEPLSYELTGHHCPKINSSLTGFGDSKDALAHADFSSALVQSFKGNLDKRLDLAQKDVEELLQQGRNVKEFKSTSERELLAYNMPSQPSWGAVPDGTQLCEYCESILRHTFKRHLVEAILLGVVLDRMRLAGSGIDKVILIFVFNYFSKQKERYWWDLRMASEQAESKGGDVYAISNLRQERYQDLRDMKSVASKARLFMEFRAIQLNRIVQRKIWAHYDLEALQKYDLVSSYFTKHEWAEAEKLGCQWANVKNCWKIWHCFVQLEEVRNYFGERTAFFFHYVDFWSNCLVIHTIVAIAYAFRHFWMVGPLALDPHIAQALYASWTILWLANASILYDKKSQEQACLWGGMASAMKEPRRKTWRPEIAGTRTESFWRRAHWALAILFVCEVVWAAAAITKYRIRVLERAQAGSLPTLPVYGEVPWKYTDLAVKSLTTVNIMVMGYIWDFFSPMLADRENWKKESIHKGHFEQKGVLVKFTMSYYPFFYLAFISPYLDSCGGGLNEEGTIQDCIDTLSQSLLIFFVSNMTTSVLEVLIPFVQAYRLIKQEMTKAKKASADRPYTYDELQAKLPPSTPTYRDTLYTNLVLGYLTMFAVTNPILPLVALIALNVQRRLWAFRYTYVSRRAPLESADSIGFLGTVPRMLVVPSVMCNTGLIFMAYQENLETIHFHHIILFILVEHLIIIIFGVWRFLGAERSQTLRFAEERNHKFLDTLLYGVDEDVTLKGGSISCMERHSKMEQPDAAYARRKWTSQLA